MTKDHFIIPMNTTLWWYGIMGFVIYLLLFIIIGKKLIQNNNESTFRKIWISFLVLREIVHYSYIIYVGKFSVEHSLPFHLCGISYIVSIIFLYKPKQDYFEFLLLLGIGGAVQSLLTPEVTTGYSPYLVIDYYISHSTIIITPLYAYIVLKMQLRDYSWVRIWIIAHLLLTSIGILNYFINSNYIYICEPPAVDNPLITGGFPYHLFGFEVFGTIHILLFYVVFKHIVPKLSR